MTKPSVRIALITAVLFASLLVLWLVPAWLTLRPRVDGIDRHQVVNNARLAIIAAMAVAGTAGTVWFAGRTYSLGKRAQVADRYTKAVEQLGHDSTSVQIGGAYALEMIATDYPDYLPTAIDVLAAYARDTSPAPPATATPAAEMLVEAHAMQSLAISLSVICKLLARVQKRSLDLSHTDLAGMYFTDANLIDSKFVGARLQGTSFSSADLRGADFRGAIIDQDTRFYKANVAGARFDQDTGIAESLRSSDVEGYAEVQWNY